MLFTSKMGLEKGTGLWVVNMEEAPQMLAQLPGEISQPKWNSEGNSIYFISGVGETDPDVKIIDKIPIWFNGEGWTYHKSKKLHSYDVRSGEVSVISEEEMDIQCFAASNNGKKIAYCQSANPLRPGESNLVIHDVDSHVNEVMLNGYMIQSLVWSPDDKQIGFMSHDRSRGYPTHVGVHIFEAEGGPVKNLTGKLDRECSRRHYYYLRSMNAGTPEPVWEKDFIYFPVSDSDRYELFKIDTSSLAITKILEGQFSLEEYSVRNGVVAYTRVNTDKPAELWVWNGKQRQLTQHNMESLNDIKLQTAERFSFTQREGA